MDLASEKQAVRRRVREAMAALPPAQRALEEELVHAAIQGDPAWRQARVVLLYKAVAPEFSVVGLTNAAWRAGKRTVFPRVVGPGALALHEVGSWTQLRPGRFGIPEPDPALPAVDPEGLELAIVPGVAWDAEGHRLGQGGGYYDRLLPRLRCPAWGVGFDCQRVGAVPREGWDVRVGRVWTAASVQGRT